MRVVPLFLAIAWLGISTGHSQAPLGRMSAALKSLPPIDVAIEDPSDTLAAAGLPAAAFRDSIRALLKEFDFPLSDTAYSAPGVGAPVLYVRVVVNRDSLGQETLVTSIFLLEEVPFARAANGSSLVDTWSFWSNIVPVTPGALRQEALSMATSLVLVMIQNRWCAEDPCGCGDCDDAPGS